MRVKPGSNDSLTSCSLSHHSPSTSSPYCVCVTRRHVADMPSSAANSPNLGIGSPSTFSTFDPRQTLSRAPSEVTPQPKDIAKSELAPRSTHDLLLARC